MAKKADKKKESEEVYTSADLKRYIGALMEDNREQIKAIGERFVDFDRKLNFHTGTLKMYEQWFGNIDRKLNSHTEMIVALAEDVSTLKTDVSKIKKNTDFLEGNLKEKVGREEFIARACSRFSSESKGKSRPRRVYSP